MYNIIYTKVAKAIIFLKKSTGRNYITISHLEMEMGSKYDS
jgi:hypothetical protein